MINKIIVSCLLTLVVYLIFYSLQKQKNKYYESQKEMYYKRSVLLMLMLMVFPFFITFYLLPENLNNPLNGIISVVALFFSWLLHPKKYM
jgi:hypothetical protein